MEWLKKNLTMVLVVAGILAVVILLGMWAARGRQIDRLKTENQKLNSDIVNNRIERSIQGEVGANTEREIKTSGEASERLNNIVNRKMEGR